jgi:hypothetical protein
MKRYEGFDWSPKDQYWLTPPKNGLDALVCVMVLLIVLLAAFL